MFRPKEGTILLFKPDKIYDYAYHKSVITKEDLLDYLSSDNHKSQSHIWHEDTKEYLGHITGTMTTSGVNRYIVMVEDFLKTHSKKMFKSLELTHWKQEV